MLQRPSPCRLGLHSCWSERYSNANDPLPVPQQCLQAHLRNLLIVLGGGKTAHAYRAQHRAVRGACHHSPARRNQLGGLLSRPGSSPAPPAAPRTRRYPTPVSPTYTPFSSANVWVGSSGPSGRTPAGSPCRPLSPCPPASDPAHCLNSSVIASIAFMQLSRLSILFSYIYRPLLRIYGAGIVSTDAPSGKPLRRYTAPTVTPETSGSPGAGAAACHAEESVSPAPPSKPLPPMKHPLGTRDSPHTTGLLRSSQRREEGRVRSSARAARTAIVLRRLRRCGDASSLHLHNDLVMPYI